MPLKMACLLKLMRFASVCGGVVQFDGHACQLLMTSREPLDVTCLGRDLGGSFASVEVSLEDGLTVADGSALLRQLGDGKSGLQAAADEVLTQVVEQCEGIPLVLMNVAGECRRRTMNLQRLLTMPNKLDDMRREPAKTLYDSLTADEQAVMQGVGGVWEARIGTSCAFFIAGA